MSMHCDESIVTRAFQSFQYNLIKNISRKNGRSLLEDRILYVDEDIVVVDKPHNMQTVDDIYQLNYWDLSDRFTKKSNL